MVNFRSHLFIAPKGPGIHFYKAWWTPYLVWTHPFRNKSHAAYCTDIPWSPSLQLSPHNTITIHVSCNDIHVSSTKDFSCIVLTHCHIVRTCVKSIKNDFSKKEIIHLLQLWHILTNVMSCTLAEIYQCFRQTT